MDPRIFTAKGKRAAEAGIIVDTIGYNEFDATKLRNLGIDSFLQVYEGQSHAQYGRDDRIPEVREAFMEIGTFLDSHLKR